MSFFSSGRRERYPANRFRDRFFQARIRAARDYHRSPRILPQEKISGGGGIGWFAKVVIFFLIAGFLTAGYFLIFSDYFLVREVVVLGTDQVKPEVLADWMKSAEQARVFGVIPGNSWPFLTKTRVEQIILPRSPRILKVVESRRVWPNKLTVTLEDRQPDVIWQSGGEFFYLSADGVAFEQILSEYATSTTRYVRLRDITEKPVTVGENLGVSAALKFLSVIKSEWGNAVAAPISEFRLPGRASPDIFASASTGWTVYFDLKSDPSVQLGNLAGIFRQEIPPDKEKDLAYVDLRLPNIAYYCYRNEPCASTDIGGR